MKSMIHLLAIPVLALAALAGPSASAAQAQEFGYALTVIENPTHLTLHYSIQWGDGSWQQFTLRPGEERMHSYAYSSRARVSPTLRVRFDETLLDDEYIGRQYVLQRYASDFKSWQAAKRYVFRISPGGGYVDLIGVN